MLFTISNTISGSSFGTFVADSVENALNSMAIDAGYSSYTAMDKVTPAKDGEINVENVGFCQILVGKMHDNLLGDILKGVDGRLDGRLDGWKLYEGEEVGKTVANQHYQIVFHEGINKGGVVFCGSGSSGHTLWTDAPSAEEVFARVLNNLVSN